MVQHDPASISNRVPPRNRWRFRLGSGSPSILILPAAASSNPAMSWVDDESRENLTEAFDLQFASTTAIGNLYTNAGTPCTD